MILRAKKLTGILFCIISMMLVISLFLSGTPAKAKENPEMIKLHPVYVNDYTSYGYVDDDGKFVIAQQFKAAGEFSADGYAIVQNANGKYGVIDKLGKYVVSPNYDRIDDFQNGYAIVSSNSNFKQGIINTSGKIIVKLDYMPMNNFHNGIAVGIKHDNDYNEDVSYAFDLSGKLLFKINGYVGEFNDGLAVLQNSDTHLYGYVNKSGKLVIKQEYGYAEDFVNGRARVRKGSNYYVINTKGKIINKIKADDINDTNFKDNNGYNIKFKGLYFSLYNRNGEAIISDVNILQKINSQYVAASKHTTDFYLMDQELIPKAIFNYAGKRLTDYSYYRISLLDKNTIAVCTKDQTYLLNTALKEIKSFPRLQGVWYLSLSGNLIQARYNDVIRYFTKQGKLVFKSDDTITLRSNVKISSNLYIGDHVGVIYPQVEYMEDKQVMDLINRQISAEFITDDVKSIPSSEYAYYVKSRCDLIGDVLHVHVQGGKGFRFTTTVAGEDIQKDYYFDMKTGIEYKLDDLFKSDSDYKNYIESNVFHTDGDYQNIGNGSTKVSYDKITCFEIMKDKIRLYYLVYSYAGQPPYHCDLTYEQLDKYINKNSGLWHGIQIFQKY